MKAETISKRYLHPGSRRASSFYVKREGGSYWLGFRRPDGVHRSRISLALYQAFMREAAANRAGIRA